MTCRPGHPPRHPDFAPDNEFAVTHGAWSERRWRPLAERLHAEVIADAPELDRPRFRLAIDALCTAQAQAALVDAWLDEAGMFDEDGHPRPAAALSDRLHARATKLRSELGLSLTSFAKVLASVSQVVARHPGRGDGLVGDVLDELLAQGQAALEQGAQRNQEAP